MDDVPLPTELPTTMRALRYNKYGNPSEVLKLHEDVPLPLPETHDILIKQYASAIDPADYKIIEGDLPLVDLGIDLPITPGFNISGVVAQMGSGCKRQDLKVGDRVIAYAHVRERGALAEYVCVKEGLVAPAPAGVSFADAAALPLVGSTSWQALKVGRLGRGESVLILGGTTATGMAALQFAKVLGASKITCTCSAASFDLVKELGATEVVDYRTQDWREVLQGSKFDVVYDCVGGEESYRACCTASFELMNLEREKCRHAFVTIVGDKHETQNVGKLLSDGLTIAGRKISSLFPITNGGSCPTYDHFLALPLPLVIELVAALAEGGERVDKIMRKVTTIPDYKVAEVENFKPLRVAVEECYPFGDEERVHAAFERLMSGRSKGKQVIVIRGEDE